MRGRSFHLKILLTVAFGALIFFVDLSSVSYVRVLADVVNAVTLPIIKLKEDAVEVVEDFFYVYIHNVNVGRENVELKKKLTDLMLVERELEACTSELEDLRKALAFSKGFAPLKYTVSRIIYFDTSGFDTFVIIEGGKDRGFKKGDVVVTKDRVVGIIESVFPSTSKVVTPFNHKFSVSVYVEGSKKRYFYQGGFPLGKLLLVKKEDKVKVGSRVLLSGAGFPKFIVGKVGRVRKGADPFFKEVEVLPLTDPREEDIVFVIKR